MELNISVIIPAYNAEKRIKRAIDSVLAQTYPAFEIIVIDDGSNDSTEELLHNFNEKIKYIKLNSNSGVSTARNVGIQKASGSWIAFLDADDEWFPEKLELQVRLIKNYPTLKWCVGNYLVKSSDTEESKQINKKPTKKICEHIKENTFFEGYIIRNYFEAARKGYCYAHTDLVLIKRELLQEAGLFDESLMRHQDWDLWWRIALRYPKVGYINRPIARWERFHEDKTLIMRRVKAKRGEYLIILYDKTLREARQITEKNPAEYKTTYNFFLKFVESNLFKSILMMVFLGHIDVAGKTLFRFDEIFLKGRKVFLKIVISIPFMPHLVRFGYYTAQQTGLARKTEIYWDYLRLTKKHNL